MNNYTFSQDNPLLKAADVAARLNISRTQAYRLMQSAIPVFKVGSIVRVCLADLERFIEDNKNRGQS